MKNINFLKEHGVDADNSIELLGDIEMYNETLNDLIEKADVALYESKKKGKNCISVYDEADIKKR